MALCHRMRSCARLCAMICDLEATSSFKQTSRNQSKSKRTNELTNQRYTTAFLHLHLRARSQATLHPHFAPEQLPLATESQTLEA